MKLWPDLPETACGSSVSLMYVGGWDTPASKGLGVVYGGEFTPFFLVFDYSWVY